MDNLTVAIWSIFHFSEDTLDVAQPVLLSHLAENIASQGYVVASIDHTDSTYRTQTSFGSTLRNRSL
ncbi:MAG: hypothetical protein HKN42_00950, partial [Granulosicoccus sp.]|nr:hypothetical protein [Granulosicoccus sp.]